jgi:predicted small secreted protein
MSSKKGKAKADVKKAGKDVEKAVEKAGHDVKQAGKKIKRKL